MNTQDLRKFVRNLQHHRPWAKVNGYWDNAEVSEFKKLVNHLSEDNEERKAIRSVLRRKDISSLLDAACGPATELALYRAEGLNIDYTGLDSSRRMIEFARRRFPEGRFVEGDIQHMPFPSNSFDTVLLKHVLEHLPGYEFAVTEAMRVASQTVIVDFFHTPLPIPFDVPIKHKRGFYENWYSRGKFERFLRDTGVFSWGVIDVPGSSGQTATIYVLEKGA